jgi:hypothetical protein
LYHAIPVKGIKRDPIAAKVVPACFILGFVYKYIPEARKAAVITVMRVLLVTPSNSSHWKLTKVNAEARMRNAPRYKSTFTELSEYQFDQENDEGAGKSARFVSALASNSIEVFGVIGTCLAGVCGIPYWLSSR